MKDEGIEMQINWESFATYNHDIRGIRFKFEDLCRQLFANENLSGNKQFRYLHANPNNHGLETEPIYDLSLFIHERRAAEYLNAKKTVLLDEISELLYRSSKRDYLRKLEEVVSALPDVNIETLYHSIEWNSTVRLAVATFLDNFGEELKKLEAERDRQYILSCDSEKERKEREEALKEYHKLGSKIRDIDILINLPNRRAFRH